MKTNKNNTLLISLLTIFSSSTIMSMDEDIFKLPEGVSESYWQVIVDGCDNCEEMFGRTPIETENPESKMYSDIELVLRSQYHSHLISQYIPEETVQEQQTNCAKAIKNNNYSDFKNSLEILKIYDAKFSEIAPDRNCIGTYKEFELNLYPFPYSYKGCLLSLACCIHPKRGMVHNSHHIDNNLSESEKSKIAIIQELIKNKVNLNGKDEYGKTAIHKIIDTIHDRKEYIKFHRKEYITIPPLNLNYEKKHYPEIIKILVDAGANIDEEHGDGISPLYLALNNRDTTSIQMLVNLGAGQNQTFWVDLNLVDTNYLCNIKKQLEKFCTLTLHQRTTSVTGPLALISLSPKTNTPSNCTIS